MSSRPKQKSTRSELLREVTSLADTILQHHDTFESCTARYAIDFASIERLQARLRETEAELASLEAQRRYETENDGELGALQRSVGSMTVRKNDLIKLTRAARTERDKMKEEVRMAYFARIGAAVEAQSVAQLIARSEGAPIADRPGLVAPQAVDTSWPVEAVALYNELDAIWKRVSAQNELVRDLLDAVSARVGVAIPPIPYTTTAAAVPAAVRLKSALPGSADVSFESAAGVAPPAPIAGGAVARASHGMFSALGFSYVTDEVSRASDSVRAMLGELSTLQSRVATEVSRVHLVLQSQSFSWAQVVSAAAHSDSPGDDAAVWQLDGSDDINAHVMNGYTGVGGGARTSNTTNGASAHLTSGDRAGDTAALPAPFVALRALHAQLEQHLQMQALILATLAPVEKPVPVPLTVASALLATPRASSVSTGSPTVTHVSSFRSDISHDVDSDGVIRS